MPTHAYRRSVYLAGLDVLFGNLGQDFFGTFERVTFNFSTMTFSLGPPR